MCQVESEQGVKKIEEIAMVGGVDCVQMGSLDLSASMGYLCWVGLTRFKKQTVFFSQTAEVWSTSSRADVCRCGPQTADLLHLKKQTPPKYVRERAKL
ncbi:putative hpcH/HpaI aldolase/citrate lyase domain, pyruvate kinase-like domain superfamily [Helianthus annuus]|nr:putative hpcH/HpaI aldolase/citrate lyase domain, pyruvate kinase-like domain superfamily [Helianthus annuus]KAJ0903457.1 putative hpcH/HpaI aldolase/citrate lyase domain, pyruvate kinase-like domain superfamily [Helianthus annuus]KAJ0906576.1 putative hpcH/HpaI aldolase/citrate lyase domain, pyruvate kinase-like domain superfamily [Helianthus annuus]